MIDVVYLFKQFPELPQAVKEVIVNELFKLTFPDHEMYLQEKPTPKNDDPGEPPSALFADGDTFSRLWQE